MKNIKKSIFSFILALAMVMTLMPMNTLIVKAATNDNVPYVGADGTAQIASCEELRDAGINGTIWLYSGEWYIVPVGGLTTYSTVYLEDGANLILADNTTLTISKAIRLNGSVNIWGQSSGDSVGKLSVNYTKTYSAFFAGSNAASKILNVNGGEITISSSQGIGIGENITFNVNGGTVTVTGASKAMSSAPTLGSGIEVLTASENVDGSSPVETYNSSDIATYKYLKIGKSAPSHTHTWAYSANGAALTATCTPDGETCPDNKTATLTLTASDTNYSGITGLDVFNTATGLAVKESDVKLYKVATEGATTDGTEYTGAIYNGRPTEKGNYYASLSVGTATAVKAFATTNKVWTAADGFYVDYTQLATGDIVSAYDEDVNRYAIASDNAFYLFYKTSPNAECFFSTDGTDASGFNKYQATNDKTKYQVGMSIEYTVVTDPRHFHDWKYSATDNKLEAYCANANCPSETSVDNKISLTLSASDTNYAGIDATELTSFNQATGLNISESNVKFYKVEAANTTTGGTLYEGSLYEGRPTVEGYYYASLTVGEGANSATAKLAFKTGKVFEANDLTVGTVVKAGDVILRPTTGAIGCIYIAFGFDSSDVYFGLYDRTSSSENWNQLNSWTVKSDLPTYHSGNIPSWYSDSTIFKVFKAEKNDIGYYYDIYFVPAHTWTYSVNGATLTATCDKGCGEETAHTATLTLSANNANYSGEAVTAEFDSDEVAAWTAAGLSVPTITYEYKSTANGTYAATTDTKNAGYYKASATVGADESAKTAVKEFTISKANITPSVTLSGWTYGGTTNTPSVTGNTASGAVTYTYKVKDADDATYSTTVPTNASNYTVKATIVETDNYNGGSATADFTIAQKEVTVAGITAVNKAYDEKTNVELDYTNVTFTGKLGTDTLTVTATGTMANDKIGTNKLVTLSDLVLGGTSAANYTVSNSSQTTTTVTVNPVIVNKVEGDFNVTGETPSKEFIVGTTSEASIHINGLELANMNEVDNVYKGILVMNGETVLVQGTEYTVTSGSVKVNLTKSYLDKLPVGTHNIKVYVKQNGVATATDKHYEFDVNVVIKAKPSTGGGSTTPTTTPTYKVPNTSVGQDINPMNKTIGLLSIALVAGCIARKKKED